MTSETITARTLAVAVLPVTGILLFVVGIYLIAKDQAALGAAMFAIGASQFGVFAALTAKAEPHSEGAL